MRSRAIGETTCVASGTNRRPISRRRRWLFRAVTLLLLWLLFDAGAYYLLARIQRNKHIFYQAQIPTDVELDGFGKKYFHAEWGWDILAAKRGDAGEREGPPHPHDPPVTVKVFGDSFAYGDGVRDNETIASYVEQNAGWSCLNYGVPAFGPDQALLKYQGNAIKSDYAILTVLDENIGRCMTVWWNFYQTGGPVGTKPRFVVRDGSLALIPNPISNSADLRELKDRRYIEQLQHHDYWSGYYREVNAPSELTWPASLTILSHLDFFSQSFLVLAKNRIRPSYDSAIGNRKFYHLYEHDSEGLDVLCRIVDEFIDTAHGRREIPVVVIFPIRDTVDVIKSFDRKPYQSLVDHLESQQADFIDFGDVFAREDYDVYYQGLNGHFTASGNQRVADKIVQTIRGKSMNLP